MTPYILALLAALAGLPSSPVPAAPPTGASCVAKTAGAFEARWAPVLDLPPAVLLVRVAAAPVAAAAAAAVTATTTMQPPPKPRHPRKRYRRR